MSQYQFNSEVGTSSIRTETSTQQRPWHHQHRITLFVASKNTLTNWNMDIHVNTSSCSRWPEAELSWSQRKHKWFPPQICPEWPNYSLYCTEMSPCFISIWTVAHFLFVLALYSRFCNETMSDLSAAFQLRFESANIHFLTNYKLKSAFINYPLIIGIRHLSYCPWRYSACVFDLLTVLLISTTVPQCKCTREMKDLLTFFYFKVIVGVGGTAPEKLLKKHLLSLSVI